MNRPPPRPQRTNPQQDQLLIRKLNRWFRSRANPLYLLLYIGFLTVIYYTGDSTNQNEPSDFATTYFAVFYFLFPFSTAYMYKDRKRGSGLAILDIFTFGLAALIGQYFFSENRYQDEAPHHKLRKSKTNRDTDKLNQVLETRKQKTHDEKQKNRLVIKEQKKQQRNKAKVEKTSEKLALKTQKKQIKNQKREDRNPAKQEKIHQRIHSAHQVLTTAEVIHRWFRARRNPLFGLLYIAFMAGTYLDKSYKLSDFIFAIIFYLPFVTYSDHRMCKLRNINPDLSGLSLLTLGLSSNVIQYCTKDGSQLIGKSLGNPINLYQALVSPDRKNRVIIWKCLGTIISGFQSDRDLSFSDIRSLTENTKAFTRDDSYQMAMESYLSTFKKYEIDKQEFLLWIEMLAEQLRTEKVEQKKVDSEGKSKNELVTVERSTRKIMKLIKENNFKILYDTYSRIPHEIERRITEAVHLEQQRTELKRQQEELKRQQDKDEEARRELQRKQAQEKLLLIRRGQLPQQRIKDLKLDLPRQPANSTDFEYICRDWLEAWGDFNVAVTPATGDGGIDVESHNCVAQAKFWVDNKVSRPDLQRLVGAASITGKIKVFFAYSSGYTNEAHEFAEHENVRMCLFAFNTRTQGFEPANFAGQWLIERLAEIHLPDPNHTVE